MDLLIIWLGSVLASIGFDLSLTFMTFKDIADQGYKIDASRLQKIGEQLNPETKKINIVALFIPIINIMFQFDKLKKYNDARPYLLDQLRVADCITPFTEEEKAKYNLNPTGLNAIIITIDSERPKLDEKLISNQTKDLLNKEENEEAIELTSSSDRLKEIYSEKQTLQQTKDMLINNDNKPLIKEDKPQITEEKQLKKTKKNQ